VSSEQRKWRTWQRAEDSIFWAEQELDEEPWTAAYGFVARDGALTLAEVRIFPTRDTPAERGYGPAERSERRDLGEWSKDSDLVPRGGLSTRVMRLLRPGEAMSEAFNQVWVENEELRRMLEHAVAQPLIAERTAARPSKPRRDPVILARVAVLYEQALSERKRPNRYIHERLKGGQYQVAERTVGGLVSDARAAGYLTPAARKGSASGSATDAAHAVLRERERATKR
jgi:hypothetical protein